MRSFVCLILLVLLLAGCGDGEQKSSGQKTVFVSIAPLRFFAERIGGEFVEVRVLVTPGQSPATYEPTAKQMTALAGSDVFFAVGVPIEKPLVPRIKHSFPSVKVVDVRTGLELRPSDPNHSHAVVEDDEEPDPHVWLDPRLARTIVANVCGALVLMDPDHADYFRSNLDTVLEDLAALDDEITKILAPVAGKDMVVFHPSYGYFAEAYGLNQVAIEHGGLTPGTKRLADLIGRSRERNVKAIFVQPQFSSSIARTIAEEIGAEVVVLDPLAENYMENMRSIANAVRAVYSHD
jgi:zinc transport system substrate-binding protein